MAAPNATNTVTEQPAINDVEHDVEEDEEEEEDPEIIAMRKEIAALEKEAKEVAGEGEAGDLGGGSTSGNSKVYSPGEAGAAAGAASASIDENSVYVGGINEMTGPDDLQQHFKPCGSIKRITVLTDKWTGRPKGYAYVEFMDTKAAGLALGFHETSIRGNTITVTPKRNNVPSFVLRGRGRGGGFRGGFGGRGRGGGFRGGRGGDYRGGGGYQGGFRGRYAPY